MRTGLFAIASACALFACVRSSSPHGGANDAMPSVSASAASIPASTTFQIEDDPHRLEIVAIDPAKNGGEPTFCSSDGRYSLDAATSKFVVRLASSSHQSRRVQAGMHGGSPRPRSPFLMPTARSGNSM